MSDFTVVEEKFFNVTDKTTICILELGNGKEICGFYSNPIPENIVDEIAESKARAGAYANLGRIISKGDRKY